MVRAPFGGQRRHALKYNARRRGDDSEEEESAGQRALPILAGFRNVNPILMPPGFDASHGGQDCSELEGKHRFRF